MKCVSLKARNVFSTKLATTLVAKCANPHGVRQAMINNQIIGSECPRCNELETWDYVVQCRETKHLRGQFIIDLLKELLKHRPS